MTTELRIMVQPNLATSGATFQVLHERDGIWIGQPTLGAQTLITANFRGDTDQKLKAFMLKAAPPDVKNFGFKNFCATCYRAILPIAVQEMLEKAATESKPPGEVPRL